MRHFLHSCIFLIILVICSSSAHAQSLSGSIVDENGNPVAYANIYVTELQAGTSCDFDGNFFLTLVSEGEYNVVVSAMGYESKNISAILREPIDFKIFATLNSSAIQMNEIVVKAGKKDPAYGIIRKVIKAKSKYINPVQSSKSEIYLKSIEKLNITKKNKKYEEPRTTNKDGSPIDPIEEMQRELDAKMNKINMVEMKLTMYHQKPSSYKEIRNAFTVYGRKESLFVPILSEVNFSFYKNLVKLKDISDIPIISPISNTAILAYKYKLLETQVVEGGQLVYKIKVTPRKKGNATVAGIIYINEGLWNIRSIDVKLYKGASKFYDQFRIQQNYSLQDSIWIIDRQEFDYETKVGGRKNFVGNTLITIDNFEKNLSFEPKFFGNEISILTKEALERDSSYWESSRPEPLSAEQKKLVHYQDSVQTWMTSDIFLDSIEAAYNKIEILDLLWNGLGFRNHRKKSELWIGSLPGLISFRIAGGWRAGPSVSYFRRFESGRIIDTRVNLSLGFQNQDLQGDYRYWMRYDPHKLADVSFSISRGFSPINAADALLNQLRASNYFLNDGLRVNHRFEVINGLFLSTNASFNNRQSAFAFNVPTFINSVVDEVPSEEFEDFKALISNIKISYTPQQRYMTEPNRKVVLGSKYPTFHLRHIKGWDKIVGSDINFDQIEFEVEQNLILGVFGSSNYFAKTGTFLNTKDVRFIDFKRFNQSDPIWATDPLTNFSLLDTAIATVNYYFEAHHIHHFNGALVNNIPLVKKLRIQAVVGGGLLWLPDSNTRHEEVFAGLERTFKIGARRRLRLGVYGILANSSFTKPTSGFRFSIDVIDTWSKNWTF